jgi:hypothetical protein
MRSSWTRIAATGSRSVSSGVSDCMSGCGGLMWWCVCSPRPIWCLGGVLLKSRSPGPGVTGCCRFKPSWVSSIQHWSRSSTSTWRGIRPRPRLSWSRCCAKSMPLGVLAGRTIGLRSRGLHPFDVDQHRVFFGHAEEKKELAELLPAPVMRAGGTALLVVGPSGCGKSSLVRAGLPGPAPTARPAPHRPRRHGEHLPRLSETSNGCHGSGEASDSDPDAHHVGIDSGSDRGLERSGT